LQTVMTHPPLKIWIVLLITALVIVACGGAEQASEQQAPTATLLPIVSRTPRLTATPIPTRTPLPTFTYTPSATVPPPTATNTLAPTATPTVFGIIQSLQRVNIRNGPSVDFSAFESLAPGTGVQVVGQNAEGTWYNIRLEDGEEGWVASRLLFIEDTPTPFPTATASPDLTALFLGTPLPTAIIGGGTVTPTPPGAVQTSTPVGGDELPENTDTPAPDATETSSLVVNVPVVDFDSINLTATALVGNFASPTPSPIGADEEDADDRTIQLVTLTPTSEGTFNTPVPRDIGAPTSIASSANQTATALAVSVEDSVVLSVEQTATALAVSDEDTIVGSVEETATALAIPDGVSPTAFSTQVITGDSVELPTRAADAPRTGVDVFAFCNNNAYGLAAPETLTAGSTIEIFWAWFATNNAQLDQHVNNAVHELKVNGVQISNVSQFQQDYVSQGGDQAVYWYVPFGPLDAGEYLITYRLTWQTAITDGYGFYGPGTAVEFEEESCNLVVR